MEEDQIIKPKPIKPLKPEKVVPETYVPTDPKNLLPLMKQFIAQHEATREKYRERDAAIYRVREAYRKARNPDASREVNHKAGVDAALAVA